MESRRVLGHCVTSHGRSCDWLHSLSLRRRLTREDLEGATEACTWWNEATNVYFMHPCGRMVASRSNTILPPIPISAHSGNDYTRYLAAPQEHAAIVVGPQASCLTRLVTPNMRFAGCGERKSPTYGIPVILRSTKQQICLTALTFTPQTKSCSD